MKSTNIQARIKEIMQHKFKTQSELKELIVFYQIQFKQSAQKTKDLSEAFNINENELIDFLIENKKANPRTLHKINNFFNDIHTQLNIDINALKNQFKKLTKQEHAL